MKAPGAMDGRDGWRQDGVLESEAIRQRGRCAKENIKIYLRPKPATSWREVEGCRAGN